MIQTAEVMLWGTRIGVIHQSPDISYASFEYNRDFVKSGIQVSPICMPLSDRIYEFPDLADGAFHGLPGMLADSLPDKFGNAVIRNWLISKGRTEEDFRAVDRLCYTVTRGMGALEYIPAVGPLPDADETVNISEMIEFASSVLNNRQEMRLDMSDNPTYSQLLQLGTSAGGARAKALIAWNTHTNEVRSGQIHLSPDFDYWLMKFDGIYKNGDHDLEDIPEYTRIEYAYYKMAIAAGIHMSECRLLQENGRYHFMTKRFDRAAGGKLHMQTLGALAHIDYNIPRLCSYEAAASYMRRLQLPAKDIEQFYRRMVFNVLAVNQDDHVKNVSFLMDKSGTWRLSPAYDLTFSYERTNRWLSDHQMTVNGKKNGITSEDLIACGKNMDISKSKCNHIISEVTQVVANWLTFAEQTGIREKTANEILYVIKNCNKK